MSEPALAASSHVVVAGGGLAGLAAACALAESGLRVTVLEQRPYLGGRASSYEHPASGEIIDNCQHILLGCCTNLRSFYERIGTAGAIRWFDTLTFIEPGGRSSEFTSGVLPPPLHSMASFLAARWLAAGDKLAIARGLQALLRRPPSASAGDLLTWLRRHAQTTVAIRRFWRPVVVSALNDDLERVSAAAAAQVFRESFLKSAEGGRMGVPAVPLGRLYDAAGEYIRHRAGKLRLRCSLEGFCAANAGVQVKAGGENIAADYLVLALPFHAVQRALPEDAAAEALRRALAHFEPSPITGIHLFFDRQITHLPHAVLLDRTIQWMFNKSALLETRGDDARTYLELVVSASRDWLELPREQVLELAMRELAEFFPAAGEARLLKGVVVKEVNATWSPRPGIEQHRPGAAAPWPRVFLAGDWTSTGWPATMEGAVRSGFRAAEGVTAAAGAPRSFLQPDLPARGLSRLFF